MKGEIRQTNCRKLAFGFNISRTQNYTERINFNPDLRISLWALKRQLLFGNYFPSISSCRASHHWYYHSNVQHIICDGSSPSRPFVDKNWGWSMAIHFLYIAAQ